MQTNGYPDLLSYTRQNRATVQIRERLDVAALEAVTGLQSDLTKATNGEVGRAHLLGKALNDVDQGLQINSLAKVRLSLMGDAVSGAREAINGLGPRGSIAVAVGNELNLRLISDEAAGSLDSVMSAFSGTQGPRNLFSGSKTDTPAFSGSDVLMADVKDILQNSTSAADANTKLDAYFNDPAGGFATKIYQGSTNPAPDLPIGNGKSVTLDLKGNDPSVKEAIRGLAVMANAYSFGGAGDQQEFNALYNSASSSVGNGTTGLVTLEGTIGLNSATLGQAESRFNSEKSTLTNAYNDMFGRDQFEAAAELQSLQVQLEASYTLTSRLSSLTLTNFLR